MTVNIRPALKTEASTLARLINMAGDGIPALLWEFLREGDESGMDVGARRAARDSGDFSFRHAWMCEVDETVAGMILAYSLPNPYPLQSVDQVSSLVRPLVELESAVAGQWYINALATMPGFRGRGVATQLMQSTEQLAAAAGNQSSCLIVARGNDNARRLYDRRGYRAVDSRPMTRCKEWPYQGDWLLLVKNV